MNHDNLDRKLDRFKGLISGGAPAPERGSNLPGRYSRLAEAVGGDIVERPEGAYCLIRSPYEEGYPFGSVALDAVDPDQRVSVSAFEAAEVDGEVRLGDLLFFDLETTGLGGAGAVPFLAGVGSLTPDGFEVRQYLLPDYPDEAAMLEDLATEMSEDKTLVTYNGAAFDMALLRDRLIINRVSADIEARSHIDLLHATRRLYKRRLGSCTLVNVERELFGFYRTDDIPGFLIPSVYFDWLSEEATDQMEQVLEHNRLDIVALHFLLTDIDTVFESEGGSLYEADDIYSLSRVYGRRKRNDKVVELMDGVPADGAAADMVLYRALALKRAGKHKQAVQLWHSLAEDASREAFLANIELAKYYEHRAKDFQAAMQYTERARALDLASPTQRQELRRRVIRLRRRIDDRPAGK